MVIESEKGESPNVAQPYLQTKAKVVVKECPQMLSESEGGSWNAGREEKPEAQ